MNDDELKQLFFKFANSDCPDDWVIAHGILKRNNHKWQLSISEIFYENAQVDYSINPFRIITYSKYITILGIKGRIKGRRTSLLGNIIMKNDDNKIPFHGKSKRKRNNRKNENTPPSM